MPHTTYHDLISEYRHDAGRPTGRIEPIPGVDGRLAYNPCLVDDLLAVRVESPDSYWRDAASWDPTVRFLERAGDAWVDAPGTPVFPASEDPFAARVTDRDGESVLVFGVVSLDYRSDPPTVVSRFYAAPDARRLDPRRPFLEIPGMKDIRLLQLPRGVAVCGRPQGGVAGIGRISFAMIDDYTDLTSDVLDKAHIFADQLAPDTKIGSNALYDLGGQIGVLGHVAIGAEGEPQRYAAAWWTIDPHAVTATTPRVIAVRDDFPAGPTKLPVLTDVVFPGSIEPLGGGLARMYCGLSDAAVGSIEVRLPL